MKHLTTITLIIALLGLIAECERMDIIPFLSIKITSLVLAYFSWKYCNSYIKNSADKFNKWVSDFIDKA